VDGAGHQLLPRAALARDDDVALHVADPLDQLVDRLHRVRAADEVVKAVAVLELALELLDAAPQLELLGDLPGHPQQLVLVERLRDVVVGPLPHHVHGVLDGAEARQDDDLGGRVPLLDVAEQLQPVHLRHAQVGDHKVEGLGVEEPGRGLAVGGHFHLEAIIGERPGEALADDRLVVHHQDPHRPCRGHRDPPPLRHRDGPTATMEYSHGTPGRQPLGGGIST